jgi:hypothetical protein
MAIQNVSDVVDFIKVVGAGTIYLVWQSIKKAFGAK